MENILKNKTQTFKPIKVKSIRRFLELAYGNILLAMIFIASMTILGFIGMDLVTNPDRSYRHFGIIFLIITVFLFYASLRHINIVYKQLRCYYGN